MKTKILLIVFFLNLIGLTLHSQTKPIFYYPFNGNTNDESGNGNSCTNYGASLTSDRFGNANSAYYFDGNTSYMEIDPTSIELANMTDFTLSMWFKKDGWQVSSSNPESRQYLFCGHTGSNKVTTINDMFLQGFTLTIDNLNSNPSFYEFTMESYDLMKFKGISTNYSISQSWNHVVFTRKDSIAYLYYNDTLINKSNELNYNISNMLHQLYIGTTNGNNSNYNYKDYSFKGIIDDVSVWNIATEPIKVDKTVKNESYPTKNDGKIDLSISGGFEPYIVTWDNGETGSSISSLNKGNYIASITDAIGSIKSVVVYVDANTPPPIQITSKITKESLPLANDGTIELTISGGIEPYSIIWDNSKTGTSINGLSKGNYSATITDAIGTIKVITLYVDVNPLPIQVISKITNESLPLNKDGAIELTISGGVKPYSITWDNLMIGASINGLSKGNYTATITDAIGTDYVNTLYVDANPPLPIQITSKITNESLPLNKDGAIELTISGGVKPYSITWDNLMIGASINGLSKGNYTATIKDAIGTIYSYSINISNLFPDPIAYYPFNNNTTDETGHENTCVNYNAQLTTDRFGVENSAYYFDGMNSYLEITPKSEEFKTITDFTISMWYKKDGWQDNRNNPTNRQYLFCGHTGLNTELTNVDIYKKGFSLALDYNKTNEVKSYYEFLCNSYTPLLYNDQTIPNDIQQKWTYVIFERKNDETLLYEDGKFIASKKGMIADISDMFHSLYIGTANGNNPNYYYSEYNYRGSIDEVTIWNKALSLSEIQYVQNSNLTPTIISLDTLSIKGRVSNIASCSNKGTIVAFDMIKKKYYPTRYDIIQNDRYIIPGLHPSKYIVYCVPDNSIEDLITPCYYPNVKYWQDAYQVDLTGNAINVDLTISGKEEKGKEGFGSINGKINVPDSISIKNNILETNKNSGETVIKGLPVILRENNKIISWTRTDSQGNYSFNNLANGTYEIVVEFQPIETQTKSVTLKNDLVESIDNNFSLYSTQTKSIINKSDSISIYPTITQTTAEIQCPNFKSYIIVNTLGEVVIPRTTNTNINVSKLVSGLYYVLITNSVATTSLTIIRE